MRMTNDRAAALRALHVPGRPVVLPNAWDAASARAIERAGFPGVATSSAAIADCLGLADGEQAPVEEMLAAATRVVRSVTVPVTVDFERGYRLAPAELVERFAATGAAGLNLEDSDPATSELVDPEEQVAFLAAVRAAALAAGVDLVINARVDAFARMAAEPQVKLASAIERANQYLRAGADCAYPIGVSEPPVVRSLASGIAGPVNVGLGLASPLTVDDLAALGVARVTFGPGLQRHVYGAFERETLPTLRPTR